MPENTTRRRLLALVGGVATVALAGCVGARRDPNYTPRTEAPQGAGEGDGDARTGDGGGGPSRSANTTVNMVSTSGGDQIFDPEVVWLDVGGTVTFVNESGTHSATAYAEANGKPNRIPSDAEAFDSGILTEQGAAFTHTFEAEGVYDYYCIPHEAVGMVGTVVVGQEFDAHDQPGLTEPDESLPDRARTDLADLNGIVKSMLGIDDHDA